MSRPASAQQLAYCAAGPAKKKLGSKQKKLKKSKSETYKIYSAHRPRPAHRCCEWACMPSYNSFLWWFARCCRPSGGKDSNVARNNMPLRGAHGLSNATLLCSVCSLQGVEAGSPGKLASARPFKRPSVAPPFQRAASAQDRRINSFVNVHDALALAIDLPSPTLMLFPPSLQDTGISSKAMSIMNSFINDIFEKIGSETAALARYNKKPTVTSREIQTSVRLILPGELAKHAVSEVRRSLRPAAFIFPLQLVK